MGQITFEDKVALREVLVPRKNAITAEDINEIKRVVNENVALTPVNIYTSDGTITGLVAIRKINLDGKKIKFENGQLIISNSDIDRPNYKLVVNGDTGKRGAYFQADDTAINATGEIIGIFGSTKDGTGIVGESTNGAGVEANSSNGIGVHSRSKGNVFQDFSLPAQTPAPSSLLDVFSESHGSRPFPRLTTAQRNAIASPANYLTIVNTDTHRYEMYHPTFGWTVIGYIEPLEVAGTVISFTDLTIYNSVASPATGNITNDLTGAKKGIIQKIYHNHTSAPTFPAGWVLRGGGIYVPSTLNIIYATFCGGTRVEYWIA